MTIGNERARARAPAPPRAPAGCYLAVPLIEAYMVTPAGCAEVG